MEKISNSNKSSAGSETHYAYHFIKYVSQMQQPLCPPTLKSRTDILKTWYVSFAHHLSLTCSLN